jgi:hypothetical protein
MLIWAIRDPGRHVNGRPVEALETFTQHWPVPLLEQASSDVDHAPRVNPHEVAVVGEVVNRAQGESIDDGRDSLRFRVFDDVRGLDESRLAQRADRAPLPIRTQNVAAEALLMQAQSDFPKCVLAKIWS